MFSKKQKRIRRHKRVRAKVFGTKEKPRLCVFCSNRHVYAQLIDDQKGKTLASISDLDLKSKKTEKKSKTASKIKEKKDVVMTKKVKIGYEVGKLIAQKALEKKIEKAVFDRGCYKYHGVVKSLAEGAREEGLKF